METRELPSQNRAWSSHQLVWGFTIYTFAQDVPGPQTRVPFYDVHTFCVWNVIEVTVNMGALVEIQDLIHKKNKHSKNAPADFCTGRKILLIHLNVCSAVLAQHLVKNMVLAVIKKKKCYLWGEGGSYDWKRTYGGTAGSPVPLLDLSPTPFRMTCSTVQILCTFLWEGSMVWHGRKRYWENQQFKLSGPQHKISKCVLICSNHGNEGLWRRPGEGVFSSFL